VRKEILILVFLLLASSISYALNGPIQLLVNDDGNPPVTLKEDADFQVDAAYIEGPTYTLTVNITNFQESISGGAPVDVMVIMDASFSFDQELVAVTNAIEDLGTEMEQLCVDAGMPGCFNLGFYVFEGGTCTTEELTIEKCFGDSCHWEWIPRTGCYECHYEDSDEICQDCEETEVCEPCNPVTDDDVTTWDECCEDVIGPCEDVVCRPPARDWICNYDVPCDPDDGRWKRVCECTSWRTVPWKTVTDCDLVTDDFYASSGFMRPETDVKPQDWANDVGLLPITNNMTRAKNNMAKVYVYNPHTVQLEPWGDIIRWVLEANEVGWNLGNKKVIIVITDEKDDSGTYLAAAQLAKAADATVFGLIGNGASSAEATSQAQHIANETGGEVYPYNDTDELTDALKTAIGTTIGNDYMVFSREEGPDTWGETITDAFGWTNDLTSGSVELPPIPRDGVVRSFTVTGQVPAAWANPSEFFKYQVRLRDDVLIFDDGWIEIGTNQPPTAYMSCTPTEGIVPLTVSCIDEDGSDVTFDPEGQNLDYYWDFELGVTDHTPNAATHTYTTGGTHHVTLTVYDSQGEPSMPITKIINATQPPMITLLNTDHPETKAIPADISFRCNKGTHIKISYFDNEDNPVAGLSDYTRECDVNPRSTRPTFPESAVYKIVAVITNGLNGPVDTTCSNCPKTVYTVVGRDIENLETPETTLVLVAGIAFVVIAVIGRKH